MSDIFSRSREQLGFHTADSLAALAETNSILDSSVLISSRVVIGANNTFYPNVVIECQAGGEVSIGDGNVFYPGTFILCSAGVVRIGNTNMFGPAGFTLKANNDKAAIAVGDGGRYCDGASVMGATTLGSGSQILGNIIVQNCDLAGGGTFEEPDPDMRAAVLKGFGAAKGLQLQTGQVVNGEGDFSAAPVQWQHEYHPKPH